MRFSLLKTWVGFWELQGSGQVYSDCIGYGKPLRWNLPLVLRGGCEIDD